MGGGLGITAGVSVRRVGPPAEPGGPPGESTGERGELKLHLVGLPHRDPCPAWEPCAYTGKLWRLVHMLAGQGHDVVLYGGPDCDTVAKEQVQVVSHSDRRRWFGDEDRGETVFNSFDPMSPHWVVMNAYTIGAVRERLGPRDIIGLTMGHSQGAVQQAFPHRVVAEVGVGYEGVMANTHRCFESEAWRHYTYGRTGTVDGRYYDTVIPNSFDPGDYLPAEAGGEYLLYMGRLTPRKGLEVIAELAKRFPVITAGQGEARVPGAEHLGVVTGKEKAMLLSGAAAVLCPTTYIEPGGGAALEAMVSGTPVITSPWGCFSETVADGVSGWKCHTLAEYAAAAEDALAGKADPVAVRGWGRQFTIDACAPRYDRWLNRLGGLYGDGWYGT